MNDDETSPSGNDPEEIPQPDFSDNASAPDQSESTQLPDEAGTEDQPDKPDTSEIDQLKTTIIEMGMKLNRLVEAHDMDFKDTEQSMQIQRLIEQVENLESKATKPYPDADNDPNPIPYLWLGADDGTNIKEQAINSNTIVTMTAGRTVTNTATLTIASSLGFYYEFLDFNGGAQVMRRVKIAGNATVGTTTSPKQIGDSIEGSESADSTEWDRVSDAKALNLYAMTRVVYNDAGDEIVYGFIRLLKYDSLGAIYHVGPEIRVTIDALEDCGDQTGGF